MKRNPRVGLLPLYLKLYDEVCPERRAEFVPFLDEIVSRLEAEQVDVVRADVCRVAPEFEEAVALFEQQHVDLIVTLHLAYSPSLEAIYPLCSTEIPILMLDTTMDEAFGPNVDASRIMYNHGIHGVQDLACMLRRRGQSYRVVAGHYRRSKVIARAAQIARGALAARSLLGTKALRIGPSFMGMGDFLVEEGVLHERLDMSVTEIRPDALADIVASVSEDEIRAELEADRERFQVEVSPETHERSVRVGLGVRRLLDNEGYNAFSANFLAFDSADGPVDTVPFLEACKAMARGVGYAGEGDVLTAGLVGALASSFGRTTFTEIFCPDWQGATLFLSHMGEISPSVMTGKPVLREKDFPYTPAQNPVVIAGAPSPGPAVFVNVAPGPADRFGLIVAPVEVLPEQPNASLETSVRGWMRPRRAIPEFLELYSRHGGTHHSALVFGDCLEGLLAFADFADLDCVVI
jgi:L-arabinose isomerase